ncbi:MAG: sulfide/dihydroorotate dehydrogenase-like FAD/NAD-binding protein [Deltaproteobacteria bacterium]|nr:sulfide/dihydroorotate dehydrogenase-like FAD/NAD-binding protein [Deltaproteobacteria bacterium]
MPEIAEKEVLTPQIVRLKVIAPDIAKKRRPGQFVILRVDERGERIPLTIVDSDPGEGTVTIVFQVVGKTTHMLSQLEKGDKILDFAGPLGKPTEIEQFGTVVVVGGGIGTAVAFPIAKGMKEAGNKVIAIVGARSKDLLVLEHEIAAVSDEIVVTTDDGSYKRPGLVTEPLKEYLDRGEVDQVVAIGPVPMMHAVSELTRTYGVKTLVSLNPIMVDGTGMCGACRVAVGGKTRFACVDGPEFDGHEVDFKDLTMRLTAYRDHEKQSYNQYLEYHEDK